MATERNVLYPPKTDEEIEAERQEDLKEWRKRAKKSDSSERDFDPGTYGCHEAFHTAWLMVVNVAGNLLEHPAIIQDPVWYRHAYKAHDELFRLYQEMGAGHGSAVPVTTSKSSKPKKSRSKGK
ncbi:hypothetical protein [Methyloligella solikamskensis]|uniref:dATP/dGTP diphosphohydrolase N-terminal domain-containing protein n=1 Tax=Methyloligella solikamskensis TaxID=1177756 RepID=A0ABW3J910_9HYPH